MENKRFIRDVPNFLGPSNLFYDVLHFFLNGPIFHLSIFCHFLELTVSSGCCPPSLIPHSTPWPILLRTRPTPLVGSPSTLPTAISAKRRAFSTHVLAHRAKSFSSATAYHELPICLRKPHEEGNCHRQSLPKAIAFDYYFECTTS